MTKVERLAFLQVTDEVFRGEQRAYELETELTKNTEKPNFVKIYEEILKMEENKSIKAFISKMYSGDVDSIIQGLSSDSPYHNLNAIIASVQNNVYNNAIAQQFKRLKTAYKNENDRYCVDDAALAALAFFGEEPYTGDDKRIKALIDTAFGKIQL